MLRRFLHRLWYVTRERWATDDYPIPVDWPAGRARVVLVGEQQLQLMVWYLNGNVAAAASRAKVRVELDVDLDLPSRGVFLDAPSSPLEIEALEIEGRPLLAPLADGRMVPLAALQPAGWVPRREARWRVLWQGIRHAFAIGPIREPRR